MSRAPGLLAVLAGMAIGLIAAGTVGGCARHATDGSVRPETALALRKQMARSLVAHGEYIAASQPLLEVKDAYPNDPELHTLLGTAYREQGLYEAAETEFRTAIKLDAKAAEAYDGLGILREVRGEEGDAAIDDFKKAIDLSPERAATYNNLGFALYVRGRYEEAVTAYRQGLRREPGVRRMRNNLGFAYSRLGHPHRAMREFERGGSKAEAQNNMGFAYEQAGERELACECYREAVALEPELEVARTNLKRTCPEATTSTQPVPSQPIVTTTPEPSGSASRRQP